MKVRKIKILDVVFIKITGNLVTVIERRKTVYYPNYIFIRIRKFFWAHGILNFYNLRLKLFLLWSCFWPIFRIIGIFFEQTSKTFMKIVSNFPRPKKKVLEISKIAQAYRSTQIENYRFKFSVSALSLFFVVFTKLFL